MEHRNQLWGLHPDIAILQYTAYSAAETAQFASDIGCKVLIPHHMDLKKKPEEYRTHVTELEREFLSRVPEG